MAKSKRQKYIFSLIGAIIYQIGMSSITIMGLLNVYITSYIQLNQKWVTMHYGLFLQPISTLSSSISSPLGGYIENKIGFHYSIILSNIIFFIGIFGLYMTQNIWLCYFFFLIIGISCFSFNIPTKNLLFYVPEKKGFILAIINVGLQIFGSILIFIGEVIINKSGYSLKKDEKLYPQSIATNTPKFYIFQVICVPIFTLFSFLFIYIYDPSFENESNEEIENKFTSILEDGNKNSLSIQMINQETKTSDLKINENEDEEEKKKKDEKYSNDIKKAIRSNQFRLLCGIAFFISFLVIFVSLTFRIFGALIGIEGNTFKYLGFVIGISNIIVILIWGCLVDKIGSKIILKITSAGCVIVGIMLCFSLNNTILFILSISITTINIQGFISAINPHIMEIFTIKYSLEIGGLISLCSGINFVICSILSFIISLYYTTGEQLKTPYKIIYIVGSFLSFIGFILVYYESGEKFNFDDDDNKN